MSDDVGERGSNLAFGRLKLFSVLRGQWREGALIGTPSFSFQNNWT